AVQREIHKADWHAKLLTKRRAKSKHRLRRAVVQTDNRSQRRPGSLIRAAGSTDKLKEQMLAVTTIKNGWLKRCHLLSPHLSGAATIAQPGALISQPDCLDLR